MNPYFDHVEPKEVSFLKTLNENDVSTVFLVLFKGQECVMKVVSDGHNLERPFANACTVLP